ncbi:MAG: Gfo/Idh/MocA family oxidoreductase [Bifidobacteriaceae bacterium]|jgi:glucose-fructose oxidoreductase|nr:Gfo/Idh/MocA family oxidoreductase [Bifidobacteriaceae bacterium]
MAVTKTWKVAVVGFDHMHAGDFLRLICENDNAELAGVWDSDTDRLRSVADDFAVDEAIRFTNPDALIEAGPEVAVVCSTTRDHRKWVERLGAAGIHLIIEKPFATSLAEADAMIAAAARAQVRLAINWPLAWYPPHRTTRRLIGEGLIGKVREVHYYDGNRGPLFHLHDKRAVDGAIDPEVKRASWWYRKANGGGSLLDYLGYGSTLSTWFRDGELPSAVTAIAHVAPGDEVDEQSVAIGQFPDGLSTYQTRWGTFTDPWTHQPQPRCGFVVVGGAGSISSFDYQDHVTVQTRKRPEATAIPVDKLEPRDRDGMAHFLAALNDDSDITGPLSVWISRSGQRIVDTALESIRLGRTVPLMGTANHQLREALP